MFRICSTKNGYIRTHHLRELTEKRGTLGAGELTCRFCGISALRIREGNLCLLNAALQNEIAKYVAGMYDDEYLFPSRKGIQPITRIQAYRILSNAAKQVGVEEIGTHTLRKTFGTFIRKPTMLPCCRTFSTTHLQLLQNVISGYLKMK